MDSSENSLNSIKVIFLKLCLNVKGHFTDLKVYKHLLKLGELIQLLGFFFCNRQSNFCILKPQLSRSRKEFWGFYSASATKPFFSSFILGLW